MAKKHIYPGTAEAEAARSERPAIEAEEPDFIGNAPNYDKFKGWDPSEVLAFLNID